MQIQSISPIRDDVAALMVQSDAYMAGLYPMESNHLDNLSELANPNVFFIGAFDGDQLVGTGAVKRLSTGLIYGEIKRVFVLPNQRGKGVS